MHTTVPSIINITAATSEDAGIYTCDIKHEQDLKESCKFMVIIKGMQIIYNFLYICSISIMSLTSSLVFFFTTSLSISSQSCFLHILYHDFHSKFSHFFIPIHNVSTRSPLFFLMHVYIISILLSSSSLQCLPLQIFPSLCSIMSRTRSPSFF